MKRLIIVGVLLASLTTCNADAQTAVSRSGPTFEQINDARLRALATSVVQSRPDYGSLTRRTGDIISTDSLETGKFVSKKSAPFRGCRPKNARPSASAM